MIVPCQCSFEKPLILMKWCRTHLCSASMKKTTFENVVLVRLRGSAQKSFDFSRKWLCIFCRRIQKSHRKNPKTIGKNQIEQYLQAITYSIHYIRLLSGFQLSQEAPARFDFFRLFSDFFDAIFEFSDKTYPWNVIFEKSRKIFWMEPPSHTSTIFCSDIIRTN